MTQHFPKQAPIRRINLEPAIGLGAGRALLLQLAHPAVAQGVEDHSEFKRNPFKRLQGTLEATIGVVYGSKELAEGIGRRLHFIHQFIVGADYSANEPDLLMWVHATLLDTALRCRETFVGPLDPDEAETYYQEMSQAAVHFGVALEDQPATLADFREYMATTMDSLQVSDVGKELIGFILEPKLPFGAHVPFIPVLKFQKLVTLGSLPDSIRSQLPVRWGPREQARYDRVERLVRTLFRATPYVVRTGPTRLSIPFMVALAQRQVDKFDTQQAARRAATNDQEAVAS
ncbi:MAG: DUF2236 domain-containing protein [Actinomycetota bacterium]|nr:DUF2236 domain-containing protein [Actinomycetota bacterium]